MDPIREAADRLGVQAHRVRAPGPDLPAVRYERVYDRTVRTTDGVADGTETIYYVSVRSATFRGAGRLLDDLLAAIGERVTRTRDRVEGTVGLDEKAGYEASVYVYVEAL